MAINTISQALRRIKELKGQIRKIDDRLQDCVCWIEPNKPVYDFAKLMEERRTYVNELVVLKERLAKTNATTLLKVDGANFGFPAIGDTEIPIQLAVFTMSELKATKDLFAQLTITTSEQREITGYDVNGRPTYEVRKHVAALSVLDRDAAVAKLEKDILVLNELIEDVNHRTVLLE